MSTPPPAPAADRNLIFGLLALQMDFVNHEQLIDAMTAWMLQKQTPLGEILCQRGVLEEDDLADLDRLVDRHIRRHGGHPQASLAALRLEPAIRQQLDRLQDPQVQASLACLAPAPATRTYAAADSVASPAIAVPAAPAPASVRYRRLREHARGGLGKVFVALDEELSREVALKEIQNRFADHPVARARFLREAEVTGQLEHPGVVPVYGLGAYPDGRPFYAMRLIRGESMHQAIARFHQADEDPRRDPGERTLALHDLLGRFVAICNAVAYAHARGVIHRDLKPANAMLGEYGETLVVDWGLARVLDQPQNEQTRAERPVQRGVGSGNAPTEMGQVVGTPAFMPPEQAEGRLDRVGVASDVLSLGATLYCLLTGQAPYNGPDVLAQARQGEVEPARQCERSVPAALEAVCQRAMAVRPEDRYPSARALAEDVQRWLADEPVSAYREPLADRLRRWGWRHRTLVSVGVALLLTGVAALAVGLGLVNAEQARTAQQRDRAVEAEQRERQRRAEAENNLARALKAEQQAQDNLKLARQAIDECFNIAKTDPLFQGPRMQKARNLLLRKTLRFYRNFRVQRPDDRALQREEAEQWFRVGYIEQELLRTQDARQAYLRARALFQKLVQAHPDLPQYQNDLARTHNNLGILLSALGQREQALKEYQQARDLHLKLVQAHPDLPQYQQDLASTHNNLGNLLSVLGQREQALVEYCQARDLFRKLVQAHPDLPRYQQDLASTHNNLGILLSALGQREQALVEYRQARDLHQKLVQAHPDLPQHAEGAARTCLNRGALLVRMNRHRAALADLDQGIRQADRLRRLDPKNPMIGPLLRFGLLRRAALLTRLGRGRDADSDWDRALQITAAAQRYRLRLQRAKSRARAGDYLRSAAEADDLGRASSLPGATLYGLACIHALNAARAARDILRPLPQREKRAEQYAREAITLLKRAPSAGFFRDPAKVADLDRDDELASLRHRDDYKQFHAGLKASRCADP
jgi:serine/threonine-protein kinase